MSALTVRACSEEDKLPVLPCHVGDPDLWFADNPLDLERAKVLCGALSHPCAVPDRRARTGRAVGRVGRRDRRARLRSWRRSALAGGPARTRSPRSRHSPAMFTGDVVRRTPATGHAHHLRYPPKAEVPGSERQQK